MKLWVIDEFTLRNKDDPSKIIEGKKISCINLEPILEDLEKKLKKLRGGVNESD